MGNITDRIEGYEELKKYDEENNDVQCILLLDDSQSETVLDAEDEGIYSGYSELWEDGFHCPEIEDEDERERIESIMDEMFVEKAERVIASFFRKEE